MQYQGRVGCSPAPLGTGGTKGLVTHVVLLGDITFPCPCPRLSPPLPGERALRTAGSDTRAQARALVMASLQASSQNNC